MNRTEDREFSTDSLERLLARPALISDRGFVRKVEAEISAVSKLRRRIFTAVSCAWLVLAFLLVSPDFLVASFQQLTAFISYSNYMPDLNSIIAAIEITSFQISYINASLIIVGGAAILSLLLRE